MYSLHCRDLPGTKKDGLYKLVHADMLKMHERRLNGTLYVLNHFLFINLFSTVEMMMEQLQVTSDQDKDLLRAMFGLPRPEQ